MGYCLIIYILIGVFLERIEYRGKDWVWSFVNIMWWPLYVLCDAVFFIVWMTKRKK